MVRLVLFDIDGTLIGSGGAGTRAFGRAFETEFDCPGATESVDFAGRTDTAIVAECFERLGIEASPENQDRFFQAYLKHLEKHLGESPAQVLPGVETFIAQLKAMAQPPTLGLLTGNIRPGARLKLENPGLWSHFESGPGAFGDEHADRAQLALLARQRAYQSLGRELAHEAILIVGDTVRDVACAQAIGARCLAVATHQASPQSLRFHGAHWAVDTLEAIRAEDICA